MSKTNNMQKRHPQNTAVAPATRTLPLPLLILVGIGVALVAALLWVLNRPAPFVPQVTGQPSAQIAQTSFDYGEVKFDVPVETVVRVKNVGDEDLIILGDPWVEVVEGCWPPTAVVSSTTLTPGQEATITIRFTMHAGMDGPHNFRVHILTNDPDAPEQEVTVLSNWIPWSE